MDIEQHKKLQLIGWLVLNAFESRLQAGMSEKQAVQILDEIFKAEDIEQIWHPSMVKFEASTLKTGVGHKPSDSIFYEDIAIVDIGFVVEGLEIDCGKTFGVSDGSKALAKASQEICREAAEAILFGRATSPALAYEYICEAARRRGYTQIAATAGHRLGPYPTPKRDTKIRQDDPAPNFEPGAWMIEIHIADGERGAFFEDVIYIPEAKS